MKKVIVLTGASSGFGALAARALAKTGDVGAPRSVPRGQLGRHPQAQ